MANHEILRTPKNWLKGCSTQAHHPPDIGRTGFKYNSSQKRPEKQMLLLCPLYGLQNGNITKGKEERKMEEKKKSTVGRLRTDLNSFCNEIHHKSRKTSFLPLLKVPLFLSSSAVVYCAVFKTNSDPCLVGFFVLF